MQIRTVVGFAICVRGDSIKYMESLREGTRKF
jgi:hypothetical protein